MVSTLCNCMPKEEKGMDGIKMKNKKNNTNKIFAIFTAVFVIGVISMIGVYAYKGDPGINGPNYNESVHEALETAMENGDYNAWIKLREENNLPMNGRMFQVINKENFGKLVEMHEANEAGDADKAAEIRTELGLGQGMMNKGNSARGSQGQGMRGSSNGGNFVDADNDGACDNYASALGMGRR